jgi:hypothetical protein
MSGRLHALPLRLAHAWVMLYTRGLPVDRREARRDELTSDLWEHAHDTPSSGRAVLTVAILGRLLEGVPADIAWRVEERAWVRAANAQCMPWYRRPIVIPVLVVFALFVATVGLSGPAATLVTGLMVLALIGLARGRVVRPAGIPPRKDPSVNISVNRRRATSLIVLAVSIIVTASTYAYAMSLETWDDTLTLLVLALGWSSLALAVGALILFLLDLARARRR